MFFQCLALPSIIPPDLLHGLILGYLDGRATMTSPHFVSAVHR